MRLRYPVLAAFLLSIAASVLADNSQPSVLVGNLYQPKSPYYSLIQFKYQVCDRSNDCFPMNTSDKLGENTYTPISYGWFNQPQGCTFDVIKILEATVYTDMSNHSEPKKHTTKFYNDDCLATSGQTVSFREFGNSESLVCKVSNNPPKK